jgi:MoaD family protein
MFVKVKFFATTRQVFGTKERELALAEGATVRTLFGLLADTPERKAALLAGSSLPPHLVVLLNGETLSSRGGLEAELWEGDVVAVFPMMGGG